MTMIFKNLFVLDYGASSLLCVGFWAWRAGATLWVACKGFFLQWLLSSWGTRSGARGLSSCGSQVPESRLSRGGTWAQMSQGMWDLPSLTKDRTDPLHCKADSLPLDQGSPDFDFFVGNRMLYFCKNSHQECLVYSWFSINVC